MATLHRGRRVIVDGIDTLSIEPTATSGQPDGWGWDVWRWRRTPVARKSVG